MNDTVKIIIGIIIFLGLFTFPIWYGPVLGTKGEPPKLDKPAKGKKCIESTAYMRASHMDLLDVWRLDVVRDKKRIYTSEDGKTYVMSLQNTCLDCHKSKAKFCDRCHDYLNVSPRCWECHIQPEYRSKQTDEKVAWRSN